jgi:cytochrome c55X
MHNEVPCSTACRARETRPGDAATNVWFSLLAGVGTVVMLALATMAIMAMTSLAALAASESSAGKPAPQRQRELIHLVRQECGFCHGLRLTGGLGSPLTAAALKDKPIDTLAAVILYGIPGTAMPPWLPFVSEAEATWIALKLQEGFPDEAR